MTLQQFLEYLDLEGSTQVSEKVYRQCRDACVGWLLKERNIKEENLAKGIFVDAVLILMENAERGRIKPSSTKVQTYLTTVCRNIQSNLKKRKDKPSERELDYLIEAQIAEHPSVALEKEALLVRVENAITALKDPCATLFKLYYYKGHSHKEIAKQQGYASESVSKSMLYKCKKSFGEVFGNLFE